MGGDHKCPVCQATFTRPQHVARHMRSRASLFLCVRGAPRRWKSCFMLPLGLITQTAPLPMCRTARPGGAAPRRICPVSPCFRLVPMAPDAR
ncbi:hypothetical protein GGX14DRAFT_467529 [Mycena pura]|uniref:C2H2-type domain-containing protein n=1 Tax=Mycena pura TaxID=153505 RepID=A0AAD6V0M7_9AGAR|nr:hypothetical protein GGX14DRAFT_467529 [Mycena pura]